PLMITIFFCPFPSMSQKHGNLPQSQQLEKRIFIVISKMRSHKKLLIPAFRLLFSIKSYNNILAALVYIILIITTEMQTLVILGMARIFAERASISTVSSCSYNMHLKH